MLICGLFFLLAGAAPQRPETERLDADQQRELEHLLADLTDARLDLSRRRGAATILLDRAWPTAVRELRSLLTHAEEVLLRRAIAQGVADAVSPDPQLVEPLLRLLGAEEASLRADAAAALGRFEDPALTRRLVESATDIRSPLPLRLGAVAALADHRTPASAAALIDLIRREDDEPALRDAAFDALARFTGLADYGRDARAWQRWWQRVSRLEGRAWAQELMRSVSTRNRELEQRVSGLASRLTDAHTQLYDAAGEEGRPAVLQRMLADDLPEVRLKAVLLVEQRLLNNQPVGDATRATMRDRLGDTSPLVRAQAARMLEILADERAASLAAEDLLAEPDAKVQAAYLRLLARVPLASAVAPALRLLDQSDLRSAAAAFLTAAHDKGLLDADQLDTALLATRLAVTGEGAAADPAMLTLLGRIGHFEDQDLIAPFLREGTPATRIAAVEAFDNAVWTAAPLLEFLTDATLRPAVWKVIAKRGRSAGTLLKLFDAAPAEPEPRVEWLKVVSAVAGRLSLEDLTAVNMRLSETADRREGHEAVLLAAAGLGPDGMPLPNGNPTAGAADPSVDRLRTEAELLLADFYLARAEPGKAKAVLARLGDRSTLTVEQRRRVDLGKLRRMLQQQALDEAATHTTQLLTALAAPPSDQLAHPWLDAAEAALAANKPADAAALVARIATLFGDKLDAASQARLAELNRKITNNETRMTNQ